MPVRDYQLNDPNMWSGLASLAGAGMGYADQQGRYNGLNNAMGQISPTSLQGWGLNGPGGMSTGFDPRSGTGNINLGMLNGAYGNLSAGAGYGAGAYSPQLLQGLTGGAASTMPQAMGNLSSAYGNYNSTMGDANKLLGGLGSFNQDYSSLLGNMRQQMQPQIQQQAYGLQNTLFGNGVMDSTGATSGALAAQNFGRGVGQADASAQLAAFQQALGKQNSTVSNYGQLSNSASSMLANAFQNFGGTNQLISGLNTAQLNNSLQGLQGAGALNTMGLNNYNASLQTGMGQGMVRNGSLYPFASLAGVRAGTQSGQGMLGQFLGQIGSNMGNGQGIAGMFSGWGGNQGNNWNFNPNANGTGSSFDYGGPGDQLASQQSLQPDSPGFNSAGGEAAGGQTASNPQSTNVSGVAGWSSGIGNVSGIFSGLGQGGVSGYTSAALNAGNMANRAGMFGGGSPNSSVSSGLGYGGNVLGIYNGLQRGGVSGYGGAALSAANMAGKAGMFGSSAGSVMPGLGVAGGLMGMYNGIQQGGLAGYGSAALNAYQTYNSGMALANALGYGGSGAAGAGAGAGAGGGSSAAGSGLGAAALPLGAMAAIVMSMAGDNWGQDAKNAMWNNINATLSAGPGSSTGSYGGANSGASYLNNMKQYTNYESAMGAANNLQGAPSWEAGALKSIGFTPSNTNYAGIGAYSQAAAANAGIPQTSQTSRRNM